MTSLLSTGNELRRFRRGLLPRMAVGAMVLIPLLYGALYLWAFWNPTGNMDKLPVAIVNADTAATSGDQTLAAGDQVVDELLADKSLKWKLTDAADAHSGVADGTYYFALTIPEDFSATLLTAAGDNPTPAQLDVTYNDANSFLATTLGRTAMAQVRSAVSETVSEQAVDTLLIGLGSAKDGFAKASDGAITLADATSTLTSGSKDLAAGADTAASGAASLSSGAADVRSGTAQLASGASQLATGTASLASGSKDLATGATSAASGAAGVAKGASDVAAGVHQTVTSVTALGSKLTTLSSSLTAIGGYLHTQALAGDTTAATLLAGLSSASSALPTPAQSQAQATQLAALDSGAAQLSTGAASLSTGVSQLAAGATTLANGAATASTGAATLNTGAQKLAAGTATLSDGAASLATGTTALATGAHSLADGATQIADGTSSLATALTDGAKQLPDDSTQLQTQRATMISSPVALDSTSMAEAEGFGEGFAPFFISLALFVGSLITWLLMRPLPSRALATPVSGLRITLAGYLPALTIAAAQVLVMLGVIHFAIGLDLTHVAGTVAFTMLVAAAFVALQQMLTALLGPAAGKVAILALLMMQLASSGGTYPVETTPQFFRILHPLLPMSYAVTGLRQTITGGVDGRLWLSVAYLALLAIGSLAVSAWRSGRLRTWSLPRLHPALTI